MYDFLNNQYIVRIKKNINHLYFRITGRIDAFFITFGTRISFVFLGVILVFNIFDPLESLIEKIFPKGNFMEIQNKECLLLFLWTGIIFIFAKYKYKKYQSAILILENGWEKEGLKNSIKLNKRYINSNYKIFNIQIGEETEKYVMSQSINSFLQNKCKEIKIIKSYDKYELPVVVKKLLPKIIETNMKKSEYLNNGKLVRMSNELTEDFFKSSKPLKIQKVGYFDGQCTHEIVYKKFINQEEIGIFFEGKELMINKESEILDLEYSQCANFLGVSTLVISSQNEILIGIQGKKSKSNKNRYAPSGSGSVEWKKDFFRTKKFIGGSDFFHGNRAEDLETLVTTAMEREFREEWGVEKTDKINTKVIGYARLLERGGKPDFFGISYINKPFDEINRKVRLTEEELSEPGIVLKFKEIEDIPSVLREFCDNNINTKVDDDRLISIQVHLITEILEQMDMLELQTMLQELKCAGI